MTLNNILKFQSLTAIYEPSAIQQLPEGRFALIEGRQRIIIVSDDGSRENGRSARFLPLDPEQLQLAPLPGVENLQ